jgi:hypothetical protein
MNLRFSFACLCVLFAAAALAADPPAASRILPTSEATEDKSDGSFWYDVRKLPIEGQGWTDTKSPYDRLPAKAEATVRDAVWNLSRHASGIVVPFTTDAGQLKVRWTLTSDRLAMPHMPATGVSGVDLYVRDDQGVWRWLACKPPTGESTTVDLVSGITEKDRDYLLYLPLYNGVKSLELNVPAGKHLAASQPRPADRQKPLVFYGTSITHGASASRPGMTHPAILGRRFERPIINLGFSGNGRMEPEVATLLAELDPAVYVIDCLPNITADEVTARTKTCVDILRNAHPTTPILLVEDRSYSDSFLVDSKRERNLTSRAALRKVFDELKSAGDDNLYYLEGENLLGDDNEGTVDSSHPTDLGFMRQADAFEKALRPILGQ